MREVSRAPDTRLGREVAIKTLPTQFAADADRLARFEREAKLLASPDSHVRWHSWWAADLNPWRLHC